MLITDHEISVLQNVPGSAVLRCSGCGELFVAECVGGALGMDDERDMVVHRSFAPHSCGHVEHTIETY